MPEYERAPNLYAPREQETSSGRVACPVQTAAQLRLGLSGYTQLQLISCIFHDGVLTLRGQVSTYYLKQLAQTLVGEVDGIREINNRLEVAHQRYLP